MKKSLNRETAAALILVMMVLTTLIGLSIGALLYTSSVAKNVQRSNNYRQELDIGDGSLELAFDYWRATCRLKANISRPGSDFNGLPLPTAAMFNNVPGFQAQTAALTDLSTYVTVSNYKITAVDPQYGTVDQSVAPPQATGMSVGANSTYYKASVDVLLPTRGPPMPVKLRRIFRAASGGPVELRHLFCR